MVKELTLNKAVAALIGVAMVVGLASALAVSRAHAVTLAELVELFIALDVIPADKADEARAVLQSQGPETSGGSMSCNFTRNLSVGDTGADVKDLQKFLNGKGYTVAASGAGSAGSESEYYGQLTAAAVAAFQNAYASEVLAPLGLASGTGYFGASTRAKANSLCAAAPSVPSVPGDDMDDDMDDDTDSNDLSGEASLNTAEIDSADEDTIDEGADDAPVAIFKAEFQDGDALITRLDISFADGGSGGTTDAWDVLESVSLWVDGDKVAEENADDRDDYTNETNGTLRFSGLDILGPEDDEVEITVAVTLQGGIDTTDQGNFTVSVDSMRYLDATDVTTTDNSTGDLGAPGTTVSWTVQEGGADDEIIVKTNTSDPDASTIKVYDDQKSGWVTVFVFDLDTNDSVNDIELTTVPVTVYTAATSTYNGLVDDARLIIDGTTIDSSSADVTGGATATATIAFDVDGDVVIDAGDRVKAELQLRFSSLATGDEGATVQGEVTSANANAIVAEGADDLDNTSPDQLTGAAAGDVHTLRTLGLVAEIVSITETKTAGDNNAADVGDYKIKVDLTSFEDTFYVSATTSAVFVYHIEDGSGSTVATSSNAAVTSTATKEGDAYRVDEGTSETFTLTVSLNPEVSNFYRVELDSVTFGTSAALPYGDSHTASPDEDFESDNLYLNA